MKFKVSDKLVKARDGASFDINNYVEGVDYVSRRAFKGVKRVFRENILDASSLKCNLSEDHSGESTDMIALTVVDPSLVEHKQDKPPIIIRPASIDYTIRQARVTKKHANQRYVETDTLGKVFVGHKGNQIKLNQFIPVQNGSLFLGDIGQGVGNVLSD